MRRIKDANALAYSTLLQATLTTHIPGEPSWDRALRASLIFRSALGVEAITPDDRKANGLMGAIARWGTIKEIIPPMPASRKNLDINQLAKRILDEATGDEPKTKPPAPQPPKSKAAVELGKLGGVKGGAARAASLTPEQRSEIARKAAQGRWSR